LSWAVSIPPTGAPALRRARAGGVARDRALLSPLCLVRTRVLAVATELPPPCARPTGALRPRALVREPRQCRTRRRARQSRAAVPVPHATLARGAINFRRGDSRERARAGPLRFLRRLRCTGIGQ